MEKDCPSSPGPRSVEQKQTPPIRKARGKPRFVCSVISFLPVKFAGQLHGTFKKFQSVSSIHISFHQEGEKALKKLIEAMENGDKPNDEDKVGGGRQTRGRGEVDTPTVQKILQEAVSSSPKVIIFMISDFY